jgi:DNA gyrase/topoisomerase IV subunit B
LIERSHIYIAQPPLYKVKAGRDERYLKDDVEEASYMMMVVLNGASLLCAKAPSRSPVKRWPNWCASTISRTPS